MYSDLVFFFLQNSFHLVGHCLGVEDTGWLVEVRGVLGGSGGHHLLVLLGQHHVIFVRLLVLIKHLGLADVILEVLGKHVGGPEFGDIGPDRVVGDC